MLSATSSVAIFNSSDLDRLSDGCQRRAKAAADSNGTVNGDSGSLARLPMVGTVGDSLYQ